MLFDRSLSFQRYHEPVSTVISDRRSLPMTKANTLLITCRDKTRTPLTVRGTQTLSLSELCRGGVAKQRM